MFAVPFEEIAEIVGQLDGEIETRAAEPGTEFSLVVPLPPPAPMATAPAAAAPACRL